ncbi:serine hydrolase [Mitsuaria sp. GD03876]|uniref:serine hydrolase domain-containing protein n=1 Tax=Mitsuaria sp. GD03876 TaxID=2975399 RepID=UPI00244C5C3D|nr:serine hydrolase [Mitsuaria sp. GD03876]MDH0865231.1 beta-lactamase family protein [Mitsuaria sp. GD03876]
MKPLLLRFGAALLAACGAAALPASAQTPSTSRPAPAIAPALAASSPPTATAGSAPAAPSTAATGARPITLADTQAWLDGLMPAALKLAQVPGAVVVIVKDGQPLIQQGYGYADWDKQVPVDARRTLFRPGSVSKLFTWTAVMQLVEQGKLDLDADLNRYLDFQIPVRDGKPMTLRHVMTHTTGFEETARDLITFKPETPDLAQVLKRYVPPTLYAPGERPGYSNYATALAGYIVQRVSGLSFDDYVEQRIFTPLGMRQSSFRQPLPPALAPLMSQGYEKQGEPAKGFEVISMPPAGSLSATGEDMGRFMLAFLQQGRLGDAQLLKPETVKQMHGQLTKPMPDLLGIGLGFYQHDINGHRVVGHGGDTVLFHSDLLLFVDDGIGLFVSVNSGGNNGQGKWLRDRVLEGFADRYLPDRRAPTPRQVDDATAKQHAQQMAGAYRNTRREDSTFFSLLQLLSPLKVEALDDGRVAIELAGSRSVFREVRPYLWEEEHGKRRLQAIVENGRVARWGLEPYVFAFIFEPVPAMSGTGALVLFGLALVTALLTTLLWPVASVLRRKHGVAAPARPVTLVRVANVGVVLAVALWAMAISRLESDMALGALLPLTQLVTIVAFVGGLIVSLWHARRAWAGGGKATRALAVTWVLAFVVLVAIGAAHHLMSFNQNF